MAKIISVTNEVCHKLKKMKNGRSFSQEINDLIDKSSKKGDIEEICKVAGTFSSTEARPFKNK